MPYYYKTYRHELGPFEERVIIAKMIDGELNSRSLIRESQQEKFSLLGETEFGAVLGSLTSRWARNIAALKREVMYLFIALAVVFILPLLFIAAQVWDWFGDDLWSVVIYHVLSIGALLTMLYFNWMCAYRMYRVVPKSRYHVTPGWRLLLTFVPFFRLGWNYVMWVSLATKLRQLTNYSRRAGRAAAIVFCTLMILSSVMFWTVLWVPWCFPLLSGAKLLPYQTILGWSFLVVFWLLMAATAITYVVMICRMRTVALAILRHRHAYNVPTVEVKSPFMLTVLASQRHRDRHRRWGHGLGIAGVLFGSPMLLIGLPLLVLLIVGSCRYNDGIGELSRQHYAASERDLYELFYPQKMRRDLNEFAQSDLAKSTAFQEYLEQSRLFAQQQQSANAVTALKKAQDELATLAAFPGLESLTLFQTKLHQLLEQIESLAKQKQLNAEQLKSFYFYCQQLDEELPNFYARALQADLINMDIHREASTPALVSRVWHIGEHDMRINYLGWLYFNSPFSDLAMRQYIDKALILLAQAKRDYYQMELPQWEPSSIWQAAPFTQAIAPTGAQTEHPARQLAKTHNALRTLQLRLAQEYQNQTGELIPMPDALLDALTGKKLTLR